MTCRSCSPSTFGELFLFYLSHSSALRQKHVVILSDGGRESKHFITALLSSCSSCTGHHHYMNWSHHLHSRPHNLHPTYHHNHLAP